MRFNIIVRLFLPGLAAVAAAGGWVWIVASGIPLWGVSVSVAPRSDAEARARALDAESEAVRARIETRKWIIEEVIAHRMELASAAARFRALAPPDPRYHRWLENAYPARSDEERFWRQVLSGVRAALGERPALAAVVLPRLEEELRMWQETNGTDADENTG